ncbi:hypothetical protein TNCV_5097671 [Trichonephila clavipes]|nr:hypothetical protein TNCV_5097671 [Trichonephila clavipes]
MKHGARPEWGCINATAQQSFTTVTPNLNPSIVELQAEARFISIRDLDARSFNSLAIMSRVQREKRNVNFDPAESLKTLYMTTPKLVRYNPSPFFPSLEHFSHSSVASGVMENIRAILQKQVLGSKVDLIKGTYLATVSQALGFLESSSSPRCE